MCEKRGEGSDQGCPMELRRTTVRESCRMETCFSFFSLCFLLLLAGCGEIGGSGQCGGVEDNGVCVTINSITPQESISIDAFRNTDCDSTTLEQEPEENIHTHQADVVLETVLLQGVTQPPAPNSIEFSQYRIQYSVNIGSPSNTPALNDKFIPFTLKLGVPLSLTTSLILVDLDTIFEYQGKKGPTVPTATYTATYTLTGTDQFANPVEVRGFTRFEIGDFDLCPGGAK